MVCVVASARLLACNENVAIVSIDPLPGNVLNFAIAKDVLREFLVDKRRLQIREGQTCHLGQAFLRLLYEHDLDQLVLESSH